MIEIAAVEVRPSLLPSFVPVLDRIFSPTTSISLPFVIQGRRRPHCSIFCGFEKKDDPYLGVVIKSACTMTTTLHQQAQQSGLAFLEIHHNSNEPHWNVNDWPPVLGGWRVRHASVVLDHPEQEGNAQTVVVLGGKQCPDYTNSVLLMNLAQETRRWREGPPLNNNRAYHAAVVCRGGVYVIGGDNGSSDLDCIERIDVGNLCSQSMESAPSNQWTTLTCRLSTSRKGCTAVAVHNRYIVVIGGSNGCLLSSVDIIDTAITSNHTVIVGPSMTVPRSGSASAVIGDRIFVVGGLTGYNLEDLKSVEYVEIPDPSGNETMATAGAAFPSSFRWTLHHKLKLSILPTRHAVVAVGSCLIVMGGSVDVLDTRRNTVWTFPPSTGYRCAYSAVVHSRGIAVIGGNGNAACATLSLVDKNTWCFRRLIEQVPSTIFGTRTNSLPSAPKRTTPSNELTRDEDNVN